MLTQRFFEIIIVDNIFLYCQIDVFITYGYMYCLYYCIEVRNYKSRVMSVFVDCVMGELLECCVLGKLKNYWIKELLKNCGKKLGKKISLRACCKMT